MTASEFERGYAERSSITVEHMHEAFHLYPRYCDCDAEDCPGWQMTNVQEERNFEEWKREQEEKTLFKECK